jgi:hypothetical protein
MLPKYSWPIPMPHLFMVASYKKSGGRLLRQFGRDTPDYAH